jgi:dGTPase
VYSVVDLEDGIKRKILRWEQVIAELRKLCGDCGPFQRAMNRADMQVSSSGLSGTAREEAMAQSFRITAISEIAIAAKEMFLKKYEKIMLGEYDGELLADEECEAKPLVKSCKSILKNSLYNYPEILKLEVRGRHVIHELMDLFWEAAKNADPNSAPPSVKDYPGKLYHLISDNYRLVFEKRLLSGNEHPTYCRLQLVTDYIAGMTDPFACRLHRDLTCG